MTISKKASGSIILLLCAFIWGSAFVAQDHGGAMGAVTFNAIRSFIGCAALGITILIRRLITKKPLFESAEQRRTTLLGGMLCGIILSVSSLFQQIGIGYTTVGNAGFITALYILIVPLLQLFLGKRAPWTLWGCVAIAVVGLFLLSVDIENGLHIDIGDLLVLCCAFCFSFHILTVDRFKAADGLILSCIQFFFAGILSTVFLFAVGIPVLHEAPRLSAILDGWFPLLYAGVLSSGVAYTLQIFGQARTPATLASLLMSLESVFALLTGIVINGEMPQQPREWIGCALMFTAIILAQLPQKKRA